MEFDYLKHLSGGAGRNEILDELMLAYGQDVWNYAYFLTRRKDLAEDIAQDVFVKAYLNLYSFRGESTVKTWLLSVTRHTALDYLKSAWMRKVQLLPSWTRREAHPSAESEWFGSQEQQLVWRTVMELPRKLREVLLLHAHQRLTMREIAQLLNVTEGTVKSRLHRARAAMNRRLGRNGEMAWEEERT